MSEKTSRLSPNIPSWWHQGMPVYYVYGQSDDGRSLFEGPKFNLEEARTESLKLYGNDFEIFTLYTINYAKAKSQVKSKLWHRSGSASESFKPMYSHPKPSA